MTERPSPDLANAGPAERGRARSTTILSVRLNGKVALGGDGQVSYGNTIMKADTRKIRWILDNKVLVGFAGSTADAFALLERFEAPSQGLSGQHCAGRDRACPRLADRSHAAGGSRR